MLTESDRFGSRYFHRNAKSSIVNHQKRLQEWAAGRYKQMNTPAGGGRWGKVDEAGMNTSLLGRFQICLCSFSKAVIDHFQGQLL